MFKRLYFFCRFLPQKKHILSHSVPNGTGARIGCAGFLPTFRP
jgi:hypothetical protein